MSSSKSCLYIDITPTSTQPKSARHCKNIRFFSGTIIWVHCRVNFFKGPSNRVASLYDSWELSCLGGWLRVIERSQRRLMWHAQNIFLDNIENHLKWSRSIRDTRADICTTILLLLRHTGDEGSRLNWEAYKHVFETEKVNDRFQRYYNKDYYWFFLTYCN